MKPDTKKIRVVQTLLLSAVALVHIGCRSARNVENCNSVHQSAVAATDSVYVYDSVCHYIRADTVYLERWHTRLKEREVVRTDTVQVAVESVRTVEVRTVPELYRYSLWISLTALLFLTCRSLYRLYLFIRRMR